MQLLVLAAVSLVALLPVVLLTAALAIAGIPVNEMPSLYVTQAVTQLLTMALPVLVVTMVYYRGRQREYYRLDFSGRRWLMALAGMVIMMLIVPLDDALARWNQTWELGALGDGLHALQDKTEGLIEEMFSTTGVGGLIVNMLVIALVPAVCEELFFRAGIQNLLERWFTGSYEGAKRCRCKAFGSHAAVWVTAVVFSLIHGEIFSFVPRVLMGAVLGYLYVYSGSLLVNMAAHFLNNGMLVVLYWLYYNGLSTVDPESDMMIGWPVTVCCTLAALTLFYASFIMGHSRATDKKGE